MHLVVNGFLNSISTCQKKPQSSLPYPSMASRSSVVHLPNGQTLTVTPVFGGLYFKSNELRNHHHSPFPPGWTIVLNSEDDEVDHHAPQWQVDDADGRESPRPRPQHHIHRYRTPTRRNDHLYISSISNPSNNEFRPAMSQTRQIAMMLWATMWWYFHQPEPDLRITSPASARTAEAGKPKGDWRVNINREGIFKGKLVLTKLERMGLIASEDSSVGADRDDRSGEGWLQMFISRRHFWQLDPRIYLFTLSPTSGSPFPSGTPYTSRPSSPSGRGEEKRDGPPEQIPSGLWSPSTPGPFRSASHLPTFYPPAPTQYTFTNHVRHPIRPKPPRQGETFYIRYVPSVGEYLSFRVASLSSRPEKYTGPVGSHSATPKSPHASLLDSVIPAMTALNFNVDNDVDLLHKWMNDARVNAAWGEAGSRNRQEEFLKTGLQSKHSFPVIGCWDGKPFGFFEIYWVKEDHLGNHITNPGNWDRGLHVLVGEQEFRGPHRVKVWLSALVHYCWLADSRTDVVMLEPRVDNEK